jgi:hypothetical protein
VGGNAAVVQVGCRRREGVGGWASEHKREDQRHEIEMRVREREEIEMRHEREREMRERPRS